MLTQMNPAHPLRVAMVAYSFYEEDNRIIRYAEALAERGDRVDVYSLARPGQTSERVLRGVHVHCLQTRQRNERGPLSYLGRMGRFLLASARALRRDHREQPFHVIHVHSVPDFEVFAAWFPKLRGARVILDIHDPVPDLFACKFGLGENSASIRILRFFERRSTHFADHVITVTHYWRDQIVERCRLPKERSSVILNYPDTSLFSADSDPAKRAESHRPFRLIYPGSLNSHCGTAVLLEAMQIARQRVPEIALDIYGSGPDLERLENMTRSLRIDDAVVFHAPVPLHAVPALMREADLGLALLSGGNRYARQALNVKLFEYLAIGLPAIATRTESTQCYLHDDIVTFSAMDDARDVARCIVKLHESPARRVLQARNGIDFVSTHNWRVQSRDYLRTVDTLARRA
jgi:glycosyltransferase involved in cell wall biosynthesis